MRRERDPQGINEVKASAQRNKDNRTMSKKTESARFLSELGKLEERICNAIYGAVRTLQTDGTARVTTEVGEYCGITLDEEIEVVRFADGDCFEDGVDQVMGIAVSGKGKDATIGVFKGNSFLADIELYWTGDLDVSLTALVNALGVLEAMLKEAK